MLTCRTRPRDAVLVEHALVDALVAAAPEHEVLSPASSRAIAWVNTSPDGRVGKIDQRVHRPSQDLVERLTPRLGLHHHAGPAAVRRVVDGAMA